MFRIFFTFLFSSKFTYNTSFILEIIVFPASSLIGVFLYFYTSFMTGRVEKPNKKDIIHFLYFIVFTAFMVFFTFFNIYL